MTSFRGLYDLPNELLLTIFHAIPYSGSSKWSKLCLVSRRFCALAQPWLYEDIDSSSGLLNDWNIRPLISTLTKRPELAACVKKLSLAAWGIRDDSDVLIEDTPFSEVVASYKQQFLAVVRDLQVPFQAQWEQDLQDDVQDAYVALLLSAVKNIERLEIEIPQCFYFEDHITHQVLNEATSKKGRNSKIHGFEKLRELELRHGDTEDGFSFRRLSSVFHLPALQKLSMLAWADEDNIWNLDLPEPWAHRTSPIRHIDIEYSDNPGVGIYDLLSFVKTLEIFKYEAGPSTVGSSMIHLPQIYDGLAWHTSTLTSLKLRFEDSFWFDCGETAEPLPSLSSFIALKVVKLDAVCLTGIREDEDEDEDEHEVPNIDLVAFLPPNLRNLTIFSAIPLKPLQKFIEAAPTKFPSLGKIQLRDWATEDQATYLQELGEDRKINVVLRDRVSSHFSSRVSAFE